MIEPLESVENQALEEAGTVGTRVRTESRLREAEYRLEQGFWHAVDFFQPRAFSRWVRENPAVSLIAGMGISAVVGMVLKRRR